MNENFKIIGNRIVVTDHTGKKHGRKNTDNIKDQLTKENVIETLEEIKKGETKNIENYTTSTKEDLKRDFIVLPSAVLLLIGITSLLSIIPESFLTFSIIVTTPFTYAAVLSIPMAIIDIIGRVYEKRKEVKKSTKIIETVNKRRKYEEEKLAELQKQAIEMNAKKTKSKPMKQDLYSHDTSWLTGKEVETYTYCKKSLERAKNKDRLEEFLNNSLNVHSKETIKMYATLLESEERLETQERPKQFIKNTRN